MLGACIKNRTIQELSRFELMAGYETERFMFALELLKPEFASILAP